MARVARMAADAIWYFASGLASAVGPPATRLATRPLPVAEPPFPAPPPEVASPAEKKSGSRNYGLRLAHNCFYWGRTDGDVSRRVRKHFDGEGSAWTRLHPPIELIYDEEEGAIGDEDELTLRCMAEHGIDRVRGGTFCQVDVEPHRTTLVAMLRTRANACYKCGRSGHYTSACSAASNWLHVVAPGDSPSAAPAAVTDAKTDAKTAVTPGAPPSSAATSSKQTGRVHRWRVATPYARPRVCDRCGRSSHVATACFAATHLDGHRL